VGSVGKTATEKKLEEKWSEIPVKLVYVRPTVTPLGLFQGTQGLVQDDQELDVGVQDIDATIEDSPTATAVAVVLEIVPIFTLDNVCGR